MVLEAILLGLSTGTYCAMYCVPALAPFLAGCENSGYKRNGSLIGAFLGARLLTYFILGAAFAAVSLLANEWMDPVLARKLSVFAYILCGLALLANSLGVKFPWGCQCRAPKLKRLGNDWVTAIVAGLAVGLHVCPPLWTAIVRSVFGGNGVSGFFYFVFFYIGTLPFFAPLFGIPFVTKRLPVIKRVARVTQFFVSLYFIFFLGAMAALSLFGGK